MEDLFVTDVETAETRERVARVVCQRVAPNALTCKRICGSTPKTAAMVKPATRGKEMMVWAKIMAPGVNNRGIRAESIWPSGPLRERSR